MLCDAVFYCSYLALIMFVNMKRFATYESTFAAAIFIVILIIIFIIITVSCSH